MASVVLDAVDRATVSLEKGKLRATRMGWVKDIDTSLPAYMILSNILPLLPAYLSAFPDPRYPRAKLMRHVVDTIRGLNTRVTVSLIYEDPGDSNGSGPASFVLERSSSLITVEAQHHPKTGEQFEVTWKNPQDNSKITRDVATLPLRVPVQKLIATGFFEGQPPDAMFSAYGKVNSAAWRGLPQAYWLYDEQGDRTEDLGKSYSIRLGFSTKLYEDWSQYAGLRDPSGGRWLPTKPNQMLALRNAPYQYGLIVAGGGGGPTNGAIRVGGFDLADFSSIFGF